MAEFQEVIRQKKRMCNSVLCCRCDIYRLCGEDLSKCQQFINNNPKKAEEVIMTWAAEHPEPVYPTWGEYLISKGLLMPNWNEIGMAPYDMYIYAERALDNHIPAGHRAEAGD